MRVLFGRWYVKRDGGMSIREQREAGRDPHELVCTIARAYGHDLGETNSPLETLTEKL